MKKKLTLTEQLRYNASEYIKKNRGEPSAAKIITVRVDSDKNDTGEPSPDENASLTPGSHENSK